MPEPEAAPTSQEVATPRPRAKRATPKPAAPRRRGPLTETPNPAFDRQALREQKRLALLHEAARLINARGSAAVSLEDVGSSLSISKAAVYYYFRSKQDLISECYAISFDVWETALDDAAAHGATGGDRVEIFIRRYLAEGLGALQPMILVREQEVLQGALQRKVERRRRALRNRLRGFIAEGVTDGSLAPVNPKIASTIIGAAISWLLRTYHPDGGLDRKAFAEDAVWLLLRGLRR
jgi:AcrR family transcriptional regulator